eukprot:666209-Prymnesium_polylepis.1
MEACSVPKDSRSRGLIHHHGCALIPPPSGCNVPAECRAATPPNCKNDAERPRSASASRPPPSPPSPLAPPASMSGASIAASPPYR